MSTMTNKLVLWWHKLCAAVVAAWHAFNCEYPEPLQRYAQAEQIQVANGTPAPMSLEPTNAPTGGTIESVSVGLVDRHGNTLCGGTVAIDDLAKLSPGAIAIGAFGLLALAIILADEPRGPQLHVKNNKRKSWTPQVILGGLHREP